MIRLRRGQLPVDVSRLISNNIWVSSSVLTTPDINGIVNYINGLNPVLTVKYDELVRFIVTDTKQIFELALRARTFGVDTPPINVNNVLELNSDERPEATLAKIGVASSTSDGYLTSQDWNRFNSSVLGNNVIIGFDLGAAKFTLKGDNSDDDIFNLLDYNNNSLFTIKSNGNINIKEASIQNHKNNSIAPGTQTIASSKIGTYRSAFFDYVATSEYGTRAGMVFSTWSGSNVEYTDVSTPDIGSSNDLELRVVIEDDNVILKSVTTLGTWDVRALVRML